MWREINVVFKKKKKKERVKKGIDASLIELDTLFVFKSSFRLL